MGRGRPKKEEVEEDQEEEEEVTEVVGDNEDEEEDDEGIPAGVPNSVKQKGKVLIVHKGMEEIGWDNLEQVVLNSEDSGEESVFFVDGRKEGAKDGGPWIFEVMAMEEETRSWFVRDNVISDGNVYACTPFDPLLLVLPALMKTSKGMPLKDHLAEDIGNPRLQQLLVAKLSDSNQMENIAKRIDCDDFVAFKYMEDKTLSWLEKKVKKTTEILQKREIIPAEAYISSNFTKSSNGTTNDTKVEEYKRYACEIVGEYLPEELIKKLYEKLCIPYISETAKRKSEVEASSVPEGFSVIPRTVNVAPPKVSAKERELQKAAKGTKSLLSFFAPKPKLC